MFRQLFINIKMLSLYLIKLIIFLFSYKLFYGFVIGYLLANNYNKYIKFYNDKRIKEILGTYIFYKLINIDTNNTPKITGMLLELDNFELLNIVNNDIILYEKYDEAINILRNYNLL
jgi:hypothetical protein